MGNAMTLEVFGTADRIGSALSCFVRDIPLCLEDVGVTCHSRNVKTRQTPIVPGEGVPKSGCWVPAIAFKWLRCQSNYSAQHRHYTTGNSPPPHTRTHTSTSKSLTDSASSNLNGTNAVSDSEYQKDDQLGSRGQESRINVMRPESRSSPFVLQSEMDEHHPDPTGCRVKFPFDALHAEDHGHRAAHMRFSSFTIEG